MLNRRFGTRQSLLLCTSLIAPPQAQSSSYRCRFSLFRTVFQRNCWGRLRAVVGGSKAIALSAFLTKFPNTSQYKNKFLSQG
ncbi:hypothetical protein [Nostoc sp.]|uniref:hypothetical protein n=1 Tax=Nostoc sp. TaxID=1180 RepID=UPI002FF8BD04